VLELPNHWSRHFFHASVTGGSLSLLNEVCYSLTDELLRQFPRSTELLGRKGHAKYHARDLDEAQIIFEEVQRRDPYCVEGLDAYSDILLVKEKQAALSNLARKVMRFAKYRPETCCIVGNHYSMKGAHERAVMYFQRALKLDRSYLAAWTLMGHEYVELKNTAAAVEAYRHAVDINPQDYRAWYGLGQTYEILKMPLYSLFYYQKASELRPGDARMWCAVANCHESLGQEEAALRCYRRAEACGDSEGIVLSKLATLSCKLGEEDAAAGFYKKILSTGGLDGPVDELQQELSQPEVEALIFLARYCLKHQMRTQARKHCERLLDCPVPEREDARLILEEIQTAEAADNVRCARERSLSRSPPLGDRDFNAHGGQEGGLYGLQAARISGAKDNMASKRPIDQGSPVCSL